MILITIYAVIPKLLIKTRDRDQNWRGVSDEYSYPPSLKLRMGKHRELPFDYAQDNLVFIHTKLRIHLFHHFQRNRNDDEY